MSVEDLPSWVERNDGYERTDEMGRRFRVRFSRFHGVIADVHQPFSDGTFSHAIAYLGDPADLIAYLRERT